MFTVKGMEFDIDFTDADSVELLEKAAKKMKAKSQDKEQYKNLSGSESIRLQCKIMNDYLDEVLGAGTSREMFGGKSSLTEHLKACEDLNIAANAASKEVEELTSKYVNRQQNRAERRQEMLQDHKKKKKKKNQSESQNQSSNGEQESV